MSNVLIDREKIDILANAISDKSGVPITMTLDEMVEAVDGIETNPPPTLQAKTYTVDSAGTETVTADSGYDGLSEVEVIVPSADPYIGINRWVSTESGVRKYNIQPAVWFEDDGDVIGTAGWMGDNTNGDTVKYNTVLGGSVTPTESSQTIGGQYYMMEGAVTVNAIPSTYVGSGITQRSSSDLTASGATVTVPSGYYSAQASKAVASGTAGTPTATKGTVSNHSVSVTPSVTNTTGYITGSTINGTAVTVSASELVSGSDTVTTNDTYDVTNLAELIVNVSGGGGVTVTDEANATGTTCVITTGSAPSEDIPLNTELIDFATLTANTSIDGDGDAYTEQYYYATDYTAVESGMVFSYKAGTWTRIGLYDSSRVCISVVEVWNDGTDAGNNVSTGTLSGSKLPSNVAYARIASPGNNGNYMSLIRTA